MDIEKIYDITFDDDVKEKGKIKKLDIFLVAEKTRRLYVPTTRFSIDVINAMVCNPNDIVCTDNVVRMKYIVFNPTQTVFPVQFTADTYNRSKTYEEFSKFKNEANYISRIEFSSSGFTNKDMLCLAKQRFDEYNACFNNRQHTFFIDIYPLETPRGATVKEFYVRYSKA